MIFILPMFLSFSAFTLEGRVLIVRGDVKMHGSQVSSKVLIPEDTEVFVGEKSYLKIQFPTGATVSFGENTVLKIKTPNEGQENIDLSKGIARWVSGKFSKKGGVSTKQAVLGIRGTDFFVNANALLGETEIICFDGQLDFFNISEMKDNKLIKKNQWGGVGGRFGQKIAPVLDLPTNVISHFKLTLE